MSPGAFLKRFFGSNPTAAAPTVPPGVVAYAIGDVHGRSDLLAPLLEAIFADTGFAQAEHPVLIGLGDYIDRGPDSRGVIDMLLGVSGPGRVEPHFLRGNHDQALLDFLHDPATGLGWCDFGGREAMRSYGVRAPGGNAGVEAWSQCSDELAAAIPETHLGFLRTLEPCFDLGDYFFAHAGARPGTPLDAQAEDDLLWIRAPFLNDARRFEKVVVHGHSAGVEPYADHRRIGIDTGAYATGQLTALRLEGRSRSLVFTERMAGRRCEIRTAAL